jgi:putative ATPase
MDLFKHRAADVLRERAPLADRMRPRTLDEFVGQEHIVGPGRLLRRAIQADQLSSVIFYGPPGTGKTTLARIIANTTKAQFLSVNAVLAGVKDLREAVETARQALELHGRRTILFVDEVHRFNKAQQDALLPHVESGLLILIGATTENPYFEVNKALVSRSRIFQLRKLGPDALRDVARQALRDTERGYGNARVQLDDDALEHLVDVANGDARGVLNALELAVETTPPVDGVVHIDRAIAEESIQQRAVLYDKEGDAHYDTISAFIKSVRGSDVDAALYWMARMVYAGEDPRFIFRRMAILACEDIGMADPHALSVVMSAAEAFDFVGMPEGRYHLAHACMYCATAPKSNSSMAFFDALEAVGKEMEGEVPAHLMDASRDGEGLGHGQGYLYPHAYRDHWIAQQYLPDSLQGRVFYQPSTQGYEQQIHDRVLRQREAQVEAMAEEPTGGVDAQGAAPKAQARQWAQRATGYRGELLARVRDRLLALAQVNTDSLVLDLHARTGLIALDAARRVRHGAVWALAHDSRACETLSGMARSMDQLTRPQVVQVSWDDFDRRLSEEAGEGVRFSSILGRNVLQSGADLNVLQRAVALLTPNGILALAEYVHAGNSRLADVCDLSTLPPDVRDALREAEERLYQREFPLDTGALRQMLGALPACSLETSVREERIVRRFSRAEIAQWFRKTEEGTRPSLGHLLRELTDQEQAERARVTLQAHLVDHDIPWCSAVAYAVLKANG